MKKSLVLGQNFKPVGYRKGLITIKKAFPRAFPLDRLTFVLRQISHWEPVLDWILLNQGHYFGLSSLLMVLTLFSPTFWWNVTQLYFQGYLVTLRCDRFDVTRLIICTDIYESESEVAQSCLTLCDPVDCSLPGSSIHGILQARILEWVAISFSRGSSWPRKWTWVSHIVARCFTLWATREAHTWLWKYKMQSFWKQVWWILRKLNIFLPCGPAISFHIIYLKELNVYVHTKTCTQMFIVILYITAKTWR